jgi:cytoskeleton protein RodZ
MVGRDCVTRRRSDCLAICSLSETPDFRSIPGSMGKVGEKLRQARERSGRSIREMSDVTKIRSDHLESLESGNYDAFSAPVYVRGFIRNYAAALKLNVAETLLDLDEELLQNPRFKEPPRLSLESKGALDFAMLQLSKINWAVGLPLLLLALILLVAVFGYRMYKHSKANDPLRNLGPGLYQALPPGETLPIPGNTNR